MPGIEVHTDASVFAREVAEIRRQDVTAPLVCELGSNVLGFADTVFEGQPIDSVYVQVFTREAEGIGPHFDVYGDYLSPSNPWVGVLNLAGSAAVRATPLSAGLADEYRQLFPERTEQAGTARRHFGSLAFLVLDQAGTEPITFNLEPGVGMVLPQRAGGTEIVHEVTPLDGPEGKYIKMVTPDTQNPEAIKALTTEFGYIPIGDLLTEALGGETKPLTSGAVRMPGVRVTRPEPDFATTPADPPKRPLRRASRGGWGGYGDSMSRRLD